MSKFFYARTEDVDCIFRIKDVTFVADVAVVGGDGTMNPGVRIGFVDGVPITTDTYDLSGFVATVLNDDELLGTLPDE